MQCDGDGATAVAFLAVELDHEVHLPRSLNELQPAEDLPRRGQLEHLADSYLFHLHLLLVLHQAVHFLRQTAGDVAVELSAHLSQLLRDEDEELLLVLAVGADGSAGASGQQRSIADHYALLQDGDVLTA